MVMLVFLLWFAFVIALYKMEAKLWMWILFVLGSLTALLVASGA